MKEIVFAIFEKNDEIDKLIKEKEIPRFHAVFPEPTDNMSGEMLIGHLKIEYETFDVEMNNIKIKRKDM